MANCRRCSTPLTGRRQLCDACKAQRPGTAETVAARKAAGKKTAAKSPAKPTSPKKAPRKTASKKAAPEQKAPAPEPTYPPGLHVRGRQLWTDLGCATGTAVGDLALEMCRMVDRLDELDRIIAGKGVLQLMKFRLRDSAITWDAEGDQHVHVTVGFQSVLTEARLQQATFKELLREFRAIQALTPPKAGPTPAPSTGEPGTPGGPGQVTGLAEFASRRAGRVTKT